MRKLAVVPVLALALLASFGAPAVATLDPLEGITTASTGADYFEVMRSNLIALQKGLDCS